MFYVYILLSPKDGSLYTGFTNDLKKRLVKHNSGRVFSTKSRRPLKLIYCEVCLNEQDAKQREKYFKTGIGKRFIKYRLKNYFQGLKN
jgi:putative endonuclease